MNILFDNEFFVLLDKPSGHLTVPGRLGDKDPRPCLSILVSKSLKTTVLPVHRLDVEVSGLVLFAKNATAHRAANLWFENRKVHKTYEAWTEGDPNRESLRSGVAVEWRSKILRGKKRAYESPHGKDAVTQVCWQGNLTFSHPKLPKDFPENFQTWILNPLTGRPHQLRYELFRHGFPIVGDALYGSRFPFLPNAIALRAFQLDFSECEEAREFDLPEKVIAPSLRECL